MKKKTYLPPETKVSRVEIESAICSGSVINPDTTQKLTIERQDFNQDWDSEADFSGVSNWTPKSDAN